MDTSVDIKRETERVVTENLGVDQKVSLGNY